MAARVRQACPRGSKRRIGRHAHHAEPRFARQPIFRPASQRASPRCIAAPAAHMRASCPSCAGGAPSGTAGVSLALRAPPMSARSRWRRASFNRGRAGQEMLTKRPRVSIAPKPPSEKCGPNTHDSRIKCSDMPPVPGRGIVERKQESSRGQAGEIQAHCSSRITYFARLAYTAPYRGRDLPLL